MNKYISFSSVNSPMFALYNSEQQTRRHCWLAEAKRQHDNQHRNLCKVTGANIFFPQNTNTGKLCLPLFYYSYLSYQKKEMCKQQTLQAPKNTRQTELKQQTEKWMSDWNVSPLKGWLMERDRCRQDETGQKLDVKKCDGIVKRFTRTGDRRGKKFRDEYPCTPESSVGATCVAGDLNLFCSKAENPFWISAT